MGINSKRMRVAQMACGLLLACIGYSASAQQLVNSDATGAGMPLLDPPGRYPLYVNAPGFYILDTSANGRYVLFSNYPTASGSFGESFEFGNCRIWRKDRQTGELLTVFESDPDGLEFCNGAKISADGNRVAAAPDGPAGPCMAVQIPANPDEDIVFDCGDVTTLLIRDLATGKDERTRVRWLFTPDPRITAGSPGVQLPLRYPGAGIHSLNANATVAVLLNPTITIGTTWGAFSIADVTANTLEKVVVQPSGSADRVTVFSVAISQDGSLLAVHATVSAPCRPDSTSATCQVTVCSPSNFWCVISPPPQQYEPAINRIYIIDRLTGAQSVPAALDNLAGEVTLAANAWSANGNYLNWFELPKFAPGIVYPCGNLPCVTRQFCAEPDCELKVHRYNFSNTKVRTRQTSFDPETVSLCSLGPKCLPQLSRDGNRLLFGRAVKFPFGGDWQPYNSYRAPVCVTTASLDSPDGAPEFVDCPDEGPWSGSVIGYSAPINWYLQDLITGHTTLVSITDSGQLFQSSGTLLADNGRTAVFRSADPRLHNRVPDVTQYDESRLPDSCFWSPAGSKSNLLVATNDNTYVAEIYDTYYKYPATPVFCPVSYPVLPANLYALDIGRGVNLAGMTFGGLGSSTVPMQTWIANPGRTRATMVGVDITISGLGTGGRVRVASDTPCEIYPATAETNDNSVLLRCELPALGPLEFRQLRWSISSDKLAFVKIDTTISSNERETQPSNNAHISYAAVWPRSLLFNWFGGVR